LHKHHSALGLATAPGNSARGIALDQRPVQPVTLIRPHAAARAARFFVEKFPGRSMYAVKANPSPELIQILWDSGITHYDVASIAEVRLVRRTLPDATLCFMHPVKAEEAIHEAYFNHGVKTFSLDSIEELDKIVRATHGASDLTRLCACACVCRPSIRSSALRRNSAWRRVNRRNCCSRHGRSPTLWAFASMSAARQ